MNADLEEKEEIVLPDIKPKKTKKPYKVSDRVLARNKKGNEAFLRNKAENERKLKEYEEMMKTKSMVKNEVEELLNDKIVNKIEQSLNTLSLSRHHPIPLDIIKEENNIESNSEGNTSDSERRCNPRFNNNKSAPQKYNSRFKRLN